jgi:hypothetical protein
MFGRSYRESFRCIRQLHDGELRDETSNSGKVYNVTDMVDGYICTKSISAAMASFNFDVFGQTTMKDESGTTDLSRDRSEHRIWYRTHGQHRRCVLPERNHSRADSSMYTGATVQLDTRSQSLMSPGECIKFKPDDLSFERRSDMRFEYAHYKKGGNMDLKTTPHHSYITQDGRIHDLLAQIKDGVWWTDSQRESVQDSL